MTRPSIRLRYVVLPITAVIAALYAAWLVERTMSNHIACQLDVCWLDVD
jgi:hypothetical protein